MPSAKQRIGGQAERRAEEFLRLHGYVILDRHVTSRFGEIDIVAQDGETIVAVEVKTRGTGRFGNAAEAATGDKLRKIAAVFDEYRYQQKLDRHPFRIDVIAIQAGELTHFQAVEIPAVDSRDSI